MGVCNSASAFPIQRVKLKVATANLGIIALFIYCKAPRETNVYPMDRVCKALLRMSFVSPLLFDTWMASFLVPTGRKCC